MNFNIVAGIGVALYTVFCLVIGLGKGYNKESVKTSRGFFLGDGTPFFILFFTTVASFFSTWIFTGGPGMFYKNGVGWLVAMTWQVGPVLLIGLLGGRYYRLSKTYGYVSPAEMVGDFYKSTKLHLTYSFFCTIYSIPMLLAQTSGCGLALYALFGGTVPMWLCTAYTAIFVGIYVFFGGFKSQAWIDTIQGLAFTFILWISVALLVFNNKVGGFANMWAMAEALNDNCLYFVTKIRSGGAWTWKMYLSFLISQGFGTFFTPYIAQRMYAAKDSTVPKKMAGLLAPYYCFIFLTTALIFGVLGRVYGLELANSDNIVVALTTQYAPLWSIIVVIGVLAAGMSTISSVLVSSTSMISVDFVKKFNPNVSDRGLRNVGRYSILVVVAIAILSGFVTIPGVAILNNISASGFLVASIPIIGMFFFKRASEKSVFWSFLIGELITAYFYIRNINPLGFTSGFAGFVIELVIFVVLSFIFQPMDKKYRNDYFKCIEESKA